MPPLEKGLLETTTTPPTFTMLLTSPSPPSRSSSSTSTTTTTINGTRSAPTSPSTPFNLQKVVTTNAHFSRRLRNPLVDDRPISNATKPKVGTNKKVQFGRANGTSDLQVDVQLIPHVNEFEDETKTKIWFTGHELDHTMNEATRTIIAVNNGELFTDDDPDFTTRGLEYMTSTGFNIAESSQQAVTTVLAEQRRQRHLPDFSGELDTNRLAGSIQAISRHRQRIAHLAAMKDARTVHGQGNFRCQVVQPPLDPSQSLSSESMRGKLRASGSMDDMRRRRHSGRTTSSLRRDHRHSAPVQGSDPMVQQLPAQLWRNSTS